jgi:hypothetical protein
MRFSVFGFLLAVPVTVAVGAPASKEPGRCVAPAFERVTPKPVRNVVRALKNCHVDGLPDRIAFRAFEQGKTKYYVLVDPQTLRSFVEPVACLACSETTLDKVTAAGTRLARALTAAADTADTAGVRHAVARTQGYFVTVDLCPSNMPGMDESIFTAMEVFKGGASDAATPVGVAVSGAWIRHHEDQFKWLVDSQRKGTLSITWINHTNYHPFPEKVSRPKVDEPEAEAPAPSETPLPRGEQHDVAELPLGKPGRLEREILGLERELLSRGVIPSPFFRFPGLEASKSMMDTLRRHLLIPISSDAWLAKKENPRPGSIVLVHGNENEPYGVARFIGWLRRAKVKPEFLAVPELF